MERKELPKPDRWNEELQDQLEERIIWSKTENTVDYDMERMNKNILAFFNDLKDEHIL